MLYIRIRYESFCNGVRIAIYDEDRRGRIAWASFGDHGTGAYRASCIVMRRDRIPGSVWNCIIVLVRSCMNTQRRLIIEVRVHVQPAVESACLTLDRTCPSKTPRDSPHRPVRICRWTHLSHCPFERRRRPRKQSQSIDSKDNCEYILYQAH